jgi:hypothetical protein
VFEFHQIALRLTQSLRGCREVLASLAEFLLGANKCFLGFSELAGRSLQLLTGLGVFLSSVLEP